MGSTGRTRTAMGTRRTGQEERTATTRTRRRIQEKLVLAAADADPPRGDDYLDAAGAHELGLRFIEGDVHVAGDLRSGFIVLPWEADALLR